MNVTVFVKKFNVMKVKTNGKKHTKFYEFSLSVNDFIDFKEQKKMLLIYNNDFNNIKRKMMKCMKKSEHWKEKFVLFLRKLYKLIENILLAS